MDIKNEPAVKEDSAATAFKKKWWRVLGQKIKAFLFAEATEQQRRNALDYYQYWYREILEEDLQKQETSNS